MSGDRGLTRHQISFIYKVWCYYAIATGLYGKKWLLAWVAPLTIYLGMIVTAVISSSKPRAAVSNGLISTQFAVSLSLNVAISTSIIMLLLYYKSMTTEALGRDAAKAYLNIMTMLLESGSLIVVIDVIAIVTVRGSAAGYVAFQMWINIQPITSFLIIYQVARGVDYFNRKAEITKFLAKAATSDYGDTTCVGFRDEQRGSDLSLDTLLITPYSTPDRGGPGAFAWVTMLATTTTPMAPRNEGKAMKRTKETEKRVQRDDFAKRLLNSQSGYHLNHSDSHGRADTFANLFTTLTFSPGARHLNAFITQL
ncbi:hypothetical protein NP233_g3575 [Leucocoprinus birnbaumii]|uniref:Transmembrane protein n=1 Tax=Leucocoprinus birnbaumii TaxID=56174 RepID=A0AAD5VYX0_9AGAR|nr:hypothetical protein NP233_g3575 [Leucocoprinus birnbaumii]